MSQGILWFQPSPRSQQTLLLVFREPGRHLFCEAHLHLQLRVLGPDSLVFVAKPQLLGALGFTQVRIGPQDLFLGVAFFLHPFPQ